MDLFDPAVAKQLKFCMTCVCCQKGLFLDAMRMERQALCPVPGHDHAETGGLTTQVGLGVGPIDLDLFRHWSIGHIGPLKVTLWHAGHGLIVG